MWLLPKVAARMPFDPMVRIFGKMNAPITGVQGPRFHTRDVWPFYQVDDKGIAEPKHFDNDNFIQVYEEILKTLTDSGGTKLGEGMANITFGLGHLYSMKAAVEKNPEYYDKAIEYFKFSNSCRVETGGREAKATPAYVESERLQQSLARKKARRLASLDVSFKENLLALPKAAKVTEVRFTRSEEAIKIIFMYEDGFVSGFDRTLESGGSMATYDIEEMDEEENNSFAPFIMDPDEHIVGVITHEKQQLGLLICLKFCTNKGRRSDNYEFDNVEPRGRQYQYWATTGCHITGFKEIMGNITVPIGTVEAQLL